MARGLLTEIERFEDGRYLISKLRIGESLYIYLRDKEQGSEFLELLGCDVELKPYWERHRREESYCLPCEVMLLGEGKVVSSEELGSLEMGVSRKLLEVVREFYRKNVSNYGSP